MDYLMEYDETLDFDLEDMLDFEDLALLEADVEILSQDAHLPELGSSSEGGFH
jgi:hypothetical protein